MDYLSEKIRVIVQQLSLLRQSEPEPLEGVTYLPAGYKASNTPPEGNWMPWSREDTIRGKDAHYWFHVSFAAPPAQEGRQLFFQLETGCNSVWDAVGPQGLLYLNGEMVQGLDVNHQEVLLTPGQAYDAYLYLYTGPNELAAQCRMELTWLDSAVNGLYYDLKVPLDAAGCLDKESEDYWRILRALERAVQLVDLRSPRSEAFYKSVDAARTCLREEFFQKECGRQAPVVNCVGHTHIDIAWLWTLAQTREKAQRSFSTVLRLMEQYPEYKFMSSQPQLYQYVKEDAPELYQQILQRVREGRWEVEGAMWLEADCNLPSGESLVRQILHGKRFMQEEFGVDSHILWLPDVFGYSAALPQILLKSGVDQFFTTKISWNEYNKLPYDAFLWQGIDGSEVFTSFGTARDMPKPGEWDIHTTYTGTTEPTMVQGTWDRFQQKEFSDQTVITYGFGDGGGGPTRHNLETQRRTAWGLPGLPRTRINTAEDYMAQLEADLRARAAEAGRIPRWVGELYLEYHRGTYTSIAKNKRNNRKSEMLLHKAESLAVLADALCGRTYPREELRGLWQTVLLNQFHDIIPGSSIHEVYEDSDRQYAQVLDQGQRLSGQALEALAGQVSGQGLLVYNPLGFARSGMVSCGGVQYWAEDVPAMGWRVIPLEQAEASKVKAAPGSLENEFYRLELDNTGAISSLVDKRADRELCLPGCRLNELQVFEDFPRAWDAWEISAYYKDKMWVADQVASLEVVEESTRKGIRMVKPYGDSAITQTIYLYDRSPRIDFETEVDWHQRHQLLKAAFPLDVHASQAAYEIQFGHVLRPTHRNTSWDEARFEVCAHKWADLSEDGYGAALLNDCKYGYSAEGSVLKLSLLKSATHPDPEADQGRHTFTYSLLPHSGGFRDGGVVQEAYGLNQPLQAAPAAGGGTLPETFSLASCAQPGVILETVKLAEDGEDLIFRFYEAYDRRVRADITLGVPFDSVTVCDLLERPVEMPELQVSGQTVTLPVRNFEIVTLRVRRS